MKRPPFMCFRFLLETRSERSRPAAVESRTGRSSLRTGPGRARCTTRPSLSFSNQLLLVDVHGEVLITGARTNERPHNPGADLTAFYYGQYAPPLPIPISMETVSAAGAVALRVALRVALSLPSL